MKEEGSLYGPLRMVITGLSGLMSGGLVYFTTFKVMVWMDNAMFGKHETMPFTELGPWAADLLLVMTLVLVGIGGLCLILAAAFALVVLVKRAFA